MMFTEVRRYAVIQLSPMGCCLGRLQFMRESGGETRRSGVRDVVKEYVHMILIGHGACIAGRIALSGGRVAWRKRSWTVSPVVHAC